MTQMVLYISEEWTLSLNYMGLCNKQEYVLYTFQHQARAKFQFLEFSFSNKRLSFNAEMKKGIICDVFLEGGGGWDSSC